MKPDKGYNIKDTETAAETSIIRHGASKGRAFIKNRRTRTVKEALEDETSFDENPEQKFD